MKSYYSEIININLCGTYWHPFVCEFIYFPFVCIQLSNIGIKIFLLFIFYYSFIHRCVYCLGHFSPLPPSPTFSPLLPHFQAEPVLPLSIILLKRRHKHNKEDSIFVSWVKHSYTERFLALLSCTNVLQPKLIHL
jgi:hypothetical protein